jgi:plastocyanin
MTRIPLAVALVAGLAGGHIDSSAPVAGRKPTTHIVRMVGASRRFQPENLVIGQDDTVKFVLVSGGPHNVAFRELTGEARARLLRQMKDTISELAGPLLFSEGESYVIPFTGVPAGSYPYICIPHLAMGTMGRITVK